MNTLLIKIDNTPLPQNIGNDVQILDCRMIADYCSLVGDALVGDIKDENGIPLYRRLNPVGQLLMNYKTVDFETYKSIIDNWFNLIVSINNDDENKVVKIKLPTLFTTWLQNNSNKLFSLVGFSLQEQDNQISIFIDEIKNVLHNIYLKVSKIISDSQLEFDFIMFSSNISKSSLISELFNSCGISIRPLDYWVENQTEELIKEAYSKDNHTFEFNTCIIYDRHKGQKYIQLGRTTLTELKQNRELSFHLDLEYNPLFTSEKLYWFIHGELRFYNDLLLEIILPPSEDDFFNSITIPTLNVFCDYPDAFTKTMFDCGRISMSKILDILKTADLEKKKHFNIKQDIIIEEHISPADKKNIVRLIINVDCGNYFMSIFSTQDTKYNYNPDFKYCYVWNEEHWFSAPIRWKFSIIHKKLYNLIYNK